MPKAQGAQTIPPKKPIPRTPQRASLQSRCTAINGGRCAVSADYFFIAKA